MTEDNIPAVVLRSAHLFIECQEVLVQLVLVEDVKLFVDEGLRATATDELRFVEHILVEVTLHLVLRVGVYVDAQELAPCTLERIGIADGRVIVEIQRNPSVGDGTLVQRHSCAGSSHNVYALNVLMLQSCSV